MTEEIKQEQNVEKQVDKFQNKTNKFIDSSIDFLFSKNIAKYLVFIVILGAILRFLVARNISALGDEMVHGPHAIGFLHSGLISTIAHSPLWFYLTDIFVKVLGVTMFSTRFVSFFFGTLSIIVVYLIATKIFNKRIAIISAFFLSISYFTIRYTLMEMDLSALFFLLFAFYAFLIATEKNKFPYLAAIFIGIASLIKTLSLFFVPAFLLAFFFFGKPNTKKQKIKKVILFGILIIFFFSPILIHNYLWYKDKGMVDIYFAQYFFPEIRPYYEGQAGYDSGLLFSKLSEGIPVMVKTIFSLDPIIVALGILGLLASFSLVRKRKYWIFLVSFQLFGFFFLILSNWLPTHYTTMIPVLCIFGGFFIDNISSKFKNPKKILAILLAIIFIFQIYMLLPHLTSRSALSQMRDYIKDNMDQNSVVLVDSRIYRGRIAWLFHDYHYLESTHFQEVIAINQNISGQEYPIHLYFVECVRDDCGWGTVTSGPLNDSSEELVKSFSSQAQLEKTILGGGGYDEETKQPYFKVYSATISLKAQIIGLIDSTHEWFYYPVNYLPKEKIYDRYEVYGALDALIYKFAWLIMLLSIFIALASPIILIYLSKKK